MPDYVQSENEKKMVQNADFEDEKEELKSDS